MIIDGWRIVIIVIIVIIIIIISIVIIIMNDYHDSSGPWGIAEISVTALSIWNEWVRQLLASVIVMLVTCRTYQ